MSLTHKLSSYMYESDEIAEEASRQLSQVARKAEEAFGDGDTPAGLMYLLEALRCLLYTSPSPRDLSTSRMPSSA